MPSSVMKGGTLPEFILAIRECCRFRRLMVVCGSSCSRLDAARALRETDSIPQSWFQDFSPNPDYSSVVSGLEYFRRETCDAILAVGGGSALDVAKCIKLFYGLDTRENLLQQTPIPNTIPLIAVPTTAGTGSEATRYAVIYYLGEKQSVTSSSIIPDYVFMDPSVLDTLSPYQKKVTVMDALCHGIESLWSLNSTEESRDLSLKSVRLILSNLDGYLAGDRSAAAQMLDAAHIAGKAINVAQTTAGHAMCYKLTSLFHIPHGHAAALCVSVLWPYMISHISQTADLRGPGHLSDVFSDLSGCFRTPDSEGAARSFGQLIGRLELEPNIHPSPKELDILVHSVNPVRLKNNPLPLSEETLYSLYRQIFRLSN